MTLVLLTNNYPFVGPLGEKYKPVPIETLVRRHLLKAPVSKTKCLISKSNLNFVTETTIHPK